MASTLSLILLFLLNGQTLDGQNEVGLGHFAGGSDSTVLALKVIEISTENTRLGPSLRQEQARTYLGYSQKASCFFLCHFI